MSGNCNGKSGIVSWRGHRHSSHSDTYTICWTCSDALRRHTDCSWCQRRKSCSCIGMKYRGHCWRLGIIGMRIRRLQRTECGLHCSQCKQCSYHRRNTRGDMIRRQSHWCRRNQNIRIDLNYPMTANFSRSDKWWHQNR